MENRNTKILPNITSIFEYDQIKVRCLDCGLWKRFTQVLLTKLVSNVFNIEFPEGRKDNSIDTAYTKRYVT